MWCCGWNPAGEGAETESTELPGQPPPPCPVHDAEGGRPLSRLSWVAGPLLLCAATGQGSQACPEQASPPRLAATCSVHRSPGLVALEVAQLALAALVCTWLNRDPGSGSGPRLAVTPDGRPPPRESPGQKETKQEAHASPSLSWVGVLRPALPLSCLSGSRGV